ncbi:hypothetical protein SAMN00017405_0447 [Desulfonispora thiosulfatigenes DSM 11270]|uniref:Uncharacterized protein n=1 Tax=Desulfonispora thiosulfatigenes DSM 11270 TaxID=656914 RepID=A0A1W1VQI5_DESTI|nr:hypothetical protein [Desulfonispora thiosulfatigenes]SMB95618.1 hypothetical protein SAMN00017405_0447 [Desulfonispora thiosulfatigenes DSM 11270]
MKKLFNGILIGGLVASVYSLMNGKNIQRKRLVNTNSINKKANRIFKSTKGKVNLFKK